MVKTMKRHEWWQHVYRQRRYLEHAKAEEIKQRLQDLMDNLSYFNEEGKIVMKNPLEEGEWELFTHVLEELKLRGEVVGPELIQGAHFGGRRYVSCKRAAQLWKGYGLPQGTYLLKFSKLKYLRPLLNAGSLRVAPASFYHDPSLNFSIRDKELEFTEELYGAKVHYPPDQDFSVPKDQWIEMPVIGNVKSVVRSDGDYYIACFSSQYEYRLYDDFEAEACLVIRDIGRFAKSLQVRVEEMLPGWKFSFGGVDYRDPYHPNPKVNIFFCKHFRYAYQKEFRFVWEPPPKQEVLKPIHLELGPLKDYCELLCL